LDIDKCPTALNNLDRLGLIEFKDDYPTGFQDWQKETQESAKELFEEWSKIESNKTKWVHAAGFVQLRGIYLTDLGNAFVSVCMKGLK
jgi:hypothetical protein